MAQALRSTLIDEWPQEEVECREVQEKSSRPITRYRNNNRIEVYLFYKRLQVSQSFEILK